MGAVAEVAAKSAKCGAVGAYLTENIYVWWYLCRCLVRRVNLVDGLSTTIIFPCRETVCGSIGGKVVVYCYSVGWGTQDLRQV